MKWNGLSKNLKFLAEDKILLVNDKCSDREYYIFRNNSMTNISTDIELTIIIISPYNNLEENIRIVLDRLNAIKVKGMSFEINYQTSGKLYIYDSLIDDIKDISFCLEIHFKKEILFEKIRYDLYKCIVLLTILILAYLIYNNQINQCYKELTTATEETIKLFTNTRIAIIVNLITGLAGTCLIEIIIFAVSLIKSIASNKLKIIIEPNIAANIFEEYVRKGTFESVADGIDDGIPIIDDAIINEVR